MLEAAERQILNRILEALRTFANHSMVEWSCTEDGLAERVAALGEVLGEDRELIELLRNVPVERGDPAHLADREPVPLLLVGHLQRRDDPQATIRAAAQRVAPGGRLLIVGDGHAETFRAMQAVGDLPDFRIGMAQHSDDLSVALARRAAVRPRIALLPDAQGACLQIRTLGPLEELESRMVVRRMLETGSWCGTSTGGQAPAGYGQSVPVDTAAEKDSAPA